VLRLEEMCVKFAYVFADLGTRIYFNQVFNEQA
jgi:hypothetical protein